MGHCFYFLPCCPAGWGDICSSSSDSGQLGACCPRWWEVGDVIKSHRGLQGKCAPRGGKWKWATKVCNMLMGLSFKTT